MISGAKFGGRKYGMPKLAANPYSKQMDCPSLHFIGTLRWKTRQTYDISHKD